MKINKISIFLVLVFILLSCKKIVESEPIWGCMDTNACNFDENANLNDSNICIFPESYDECCEDKQLDRCGVCGGDDTSCLLFSHYRSYDYDDSLCLGNFSETEANTENYFLSILNHDNILLNTEDLYFLEIDTLVGSQIQLKNWDSQQNTFFVLDTIYNNDTTFLSLKSSLDDGLCKKNIFYSLYDEIFESQNDACCNYNEFSIYDSNCEILDCDGVCNGDNNPDCNGDCGGNAYLDECDQCCNGNTDIECSYFNSINDFGGLYDCNSECYGNELPDCNGICFGDSILDDDGNCCGLDDVDGCNMCSNYNELGEATDEWPIIWYEDFSSNSLNPNHWNLEYWESGRYNNELQAYTPRSDNVYIEEGKLVIQALRENFTYVNYITGEEIPAEFTSARLNTKLKVDFRPLNCGPNQGGEIRVDVVAKLPNGNGTWPAIWLLPSFNMYGQWPSSGEIDIMEHSPQVTGINNILCSVHTQEYNFGSDGWYQSGQTSESSSLNLGDPIDNATTEFLQYSLIWSTNNIQILVNDQQILSYDNSCNGFESWPFSQSFHLLINLAIGGGLGGEVDNSVFPQKFYIDEITIRQNNCY